MDFTDRGLRPQPNSSNNLEQTPTTPAPGSAKKPGRLHKLKNHRLLNITYVTLLFSITILLVGITILIFLFDGNKEDKLVDTGKYQAVFLNGGQVYFGKITDVNDKFISLADIYYLQVNQTVQPDSKKTNNNFTLTKLGCELHRPQDVMVINQSQVIFWENLKDDSSQNTVPGGIKKLQETPQNCEQQSQTNTNNSSNSNSTNTDTSNNNNTSANSTDNSNTNSSSSSSNKPNSGQ